MRDFFVLNFNIVSKTTIINSNDFAKNFIQTVLLVI